MKDVKPIYESELYAVIKRSAGVFAVVLKSNFNNVQFTGTRGYALDWARSNSGEGEE